MKSNQYITMLLAISGICVFGVYTSLDAQQEIVKKVSKKYSINQNTSLSIDNTYGNIDVRDWTNNEIKIDVEVVVFDKGKSRSEDLAKLVSINFDDIGDAINVQTQYDDAFFKNMDKNFHSEDKQFEVNYIVMMPSNLNVHIKNKYGNVFINKLNSKSTIDIKYGNLKANQLLSASKENMSEIKLAYSNGTVEKCEWLKLTISYSKLMIQSSKALILMSKYSKIEIEQGSSIVCESKYDTYEVGSLSNFVTNAQYSNFRFESIKNKISIDTKYTDFKVKAIPASFESIDILNSYGSIILGIVPNATYHLVGLAKYAKINIPEEGRVNRIQENNEQSLEGIVGKGGTKLPTVKIDTKYGGINLVQ